ncbi:MAG: DUF1491 family protein [Alphaproteobacteria bacterium]
MTARLKAGIWVRAHIRRCEVAGAPAFVVAKGDESAGAVLIKVNRLGGGCEVFTASTGLDGGRRWLNGTGAAPVAEADADAYIARQRGYDPDLWVIEIEDREGRHFLDEPVE